MIWLPDRSKSKTMLTLRDYNDMVNEDTVKNLFLNLVYSFLAYSIPLIKLMFMLLWGKTYSGNHYDNHNKNHCSKEGTSAVQLPSGSHSTSFGSHSTIKEEQRVLLVEKQGKNQEQFIRGPPQSRLNRNKKCLPSESSISRVGVVGTAWSKASRNIHQLCSWPNVLNNDYVLSNTYKAHRKACCYVLCYAGHFVLETWSREFIGDSLLFKWPLFVQKTLGEKTNSKFNPRTSAA
jgi:hypothetical protein